MNDIMLYPLALVRKHFDQAATHYDAHAVVQREIADRLLDHLDGVNLKPQTILDVGCGTGYCARLLKRRYPSARIIGVDLSPAMVQQAKKQRRWFARNPEYITGDAQALTMEDSSVDLLVSSLAIQWCDPDKTFQEFARVLKPGGLLLVSSFGPDTLSELRHAWSAVDRHQHQHVHTFIDMHDLGDAIVRNGMAAPVLDVDRLVLTYKKVGDILRDLKGIGAQNLAPDRQRGLMGKTLFKSFCEAYEAQFKDKQLQVTYEAVFAHAWAPQTDMSGETVIPFPPPFSRQ